MKKINRSIISKSISALVMCSAPLFASAEVVVLKAANIITTDEKNPRAEAITFNVDTKKITAVGSLEVVKYADLVELSADITTVNPNDIMNK